MIMCASVATLERRLKAAGRAADMLRALPDVGIRDWSGDALWMGEPKVLDAWIFEASQSLAHAITCAVSVIDFPTVMIDGWLPDHVRAGITERTRSLLAAQNLMGLETPQVISGTIGHTARALGAAGLPLMEHFLVNDRVFRKGAVKNQ